VDNADPTAVPAASRSRRPSCDPWNKDTRHSNACRRGLSRSCRKDWCACACHTRPAADPPVQPIKKGTIE
jgi:hypothetical protein